MPSIRVRQRVRVVVHRIDAPRVAGAVVVGVADAVQHRIAQVDVGRGHVDLGAQHVGAVGELAGAHAAEQVEVLLDAAVAVRAVGAGLGERAAVGADLVGRVRVDVGLATSDQLLGILVELLEVVRRVVLAVVPVEAEPADVVLDRVDVLDVFLDRIGVVEAQVAGAAVTRRRRRSSGRWTWRGRCAGSRWARAESAWSRARRRPRRLRRRRPARARNQARGLRPHGRRRRSNGPMTS